MFATGPTQSGKTLLCFVIVIMYHLFEVGETVLCAAPSQDIAKDKWLTDILPAINASRYRDLIPDKGAGSKGGDLTRIDFKNGATLRFMTAGGGDKARASFTSRVLVVTEVEGFDEIGGSSRETDKFTQLEQRTEAFPTTSLTYGECTVGTEEGRTWYEVTKGSNSRIAMRCPHCSEFVTPDRDHLIGWKDAKTELAAEQQSRIVCPSCGTMWEESERAAAAAGAIILHGEQVAGPNGEVNGDMPSTRTLGFRWTAATNLLKPIGVTAVKEWKAVRAANAESAEKGLRQFSWALPHVADAKAVNKLSVHEIAARVLPQVPFRTLPDDTESVTVGCDVGKYFLTYVVIAWRRTPEGVSPHVVEHGTLNVDSATFGENLAILQALRRFRDEELPKGWQRAGGGEPMLAKLVAIDAGNWQQLITDFVAESPGFAAVKGFGTTRFGGREERAKGSKLVAQGPGWEAWQIPGLGVPLIEANSDYWKSLVHAALETPTSKVGAMTLSEPPAETPTAHLTFARQVLAEKKEEKFEPGKGLVTKWNAVSRDNHRLDATSLACSAGGMSGQQVVPVSREKPQPEPNKTKDRDRPSWADDKPSWTN